MSNHNTHPNYNKSSDRQKNGGAFGYLGKPQDAYTEEDLIALGKELVDYMNEPRSLWAKGFCNRKGITQSHFNYLLSSYPIFYEYWQQAKEIQEEKLIVHPFWKEADGNHARFILERAHKGIWEPKTESVGTDQDASNLSKSLDTVEFLQSLLALKMEESKSKADAKS